MTLAQQTILIIDDHRLFADGLSVLLRQMDEALTVTTQYSAQAALAKPEWLETFDLLLIDVNMPNLTGFDFLQAEALEVGDIIINEIMADESPQRQLPDTEFVEIYNRSDKVIDLGTLSLVSDSSPDVLASQ